MLPVVPVRANSTVSRGASVPKPLTVVVPFCEKLLAVAKSP